MKRAGLYIFSFFFLGVYVLSLNRPFMEWWADFRTYTLHAAYTKARYGDLYSNCFLPGYIDTAYIPLKVYPRAGGTTDLYILHDSYLAGKIRTENFNGIGKLVLADYRGETVSLRPDTARRNILIIECSERTALWRLSDTATAYSKMNAGGRRSEAAQAASGMPMQEYFFNPNINQNLEFALYDYEWFRPLKHLKAQINFNLFDRLPQDVSVSTDKKYLLLTETVDPHSAISSFAALDAGWVDYVVACINQMRAYYTAQGFDEVYFSIVPNPVSIIDQARLPYNHKIEVLEGHPALAMPPVSVYQRFGQTSLRIYRRDDSHWNNHGLQLWIDEVNKHITP
jgi:hypothetical protein